jgi:tetratricopeptide (TPR) repeat protein
MRARSLPPCLLVLAGLALASAPVSAQDESGRRAKETYEHAVELDTRGNHAAALSLLWEAAGLAPRDADIQNRLGEALERIGAFDAAVDAYRAALAARPAFTKASNNLILTLVKSGKGAEAVARARALVAEAPDDPERYFTLGLAQSEQDVDGALQSLQHALTLAPRHVLARYNLALVLRRADRVPEAIAEFRRALAIERRPEIQYALGVTYWHQGDLDQAAEALRSAIETQADYADAHYTLGAVLKAKNDLSGAAASLRRAIVLQPDLSAAHYLLGLVLQAMHDEGGAHAELAEAQRLRARAASEQEAIVWTAVGTEKLNDGDAAGAVACFTRATTSLDAYAPAHYQLGRALLRLGRRDAARAAFARAHQLNPSLVAPK